MCNIHNNDNYSKYSFNASSLYCFIATTLGTVVAPRVYWLMILIRYVVKGQGQTVGLTLDKLNWLG